MLSFVDTRILLLLAVTSCLATSQCKCLWSCLQPGGDGWGGGSAKDYCLPLTPSPALPFAGCWGNPRSDQAGHVSKLEKIHSAWIATGLFRFGSQSASRHPMERARKELFSITRTK